MKKEEVHARIEEIGIVPAVRTSSAEDARFAAEAVSRGGIPIVEITMTVPGAIEVISSLAKNIPDMLVGAGSVLDVETARRCLDAGAQFLTTDGLDLESCGICGETARRRISRHIDPHRSDHRLEGWLGLCQSGPLRASRRRQLYPRAESAFAPGSSDRRGGVNQLTALNFILAGATALGVGRELIPREAIRHAAIGPDSGTGAPLRQLCDQWPHPSCGPAKIVSGLTR